jgi:hypothetical protein
VVFEFIHLVAWDSHFLAADDLDGVVGELEVEGVDIAFFIVAYFTLDNIVGGSWTDSSLGGCRGQD